MQPPLRKAKDRKMRRKRKSGEGEGVGVGEQVSKPRARKDERKKESPSVGGEKEEMAPIVGRQQQCR